MIICSILPFLKDAKGIFTLFVIMFNNSYIESVMKTIRLPCYFCGLDSAQRSISISITHFDPVTIKTLNLLIHSHFARIVDRQKAFILTYRIVVFFNVSFLVLFLFLYCFIICLFLYRNLSLTAVATYRHEPLTEQLKREGWQSMHSNGLRWHHSFH